MRWEAPADERKGVAKEGAGGEHGFPVEPGGRKGFFSVGDFLDGHGVKGGPGGGRFSLNYDHAIGTTPERQAHCPLPAGARIAQVGFGEIGRGHTLDGAGLVPPGADAETALY